MDAMTKISEAWLSVARECPRFEYEIGKGRLTVDEVALRHQRGEYVHHLPSGEDWATSCMCVESCGKKMQGWTKTATQTAAEDAA